MPTAPYRARFHRRFLDGLFALLTNKAGNASRHRKQNIWSACCLPAEHCACVYPAGLTASMVKLVTPNSLGQSDAPAAQSGLPANGEY